MQKIEVRSAPHRKVAVANLLPNPHRDLKLNPTVPDRVDDLIASIERTGFWDNIVVRESPKREGKYEIAYGHNRLAALEDKRIDVDTITIPVAQLSDWDMYCAMVDENATQGGLTIAIAQENVGRGCELIEAAFDQIGSEGTWEQFNDAMGRSRGARHDSPYDSSYEQARADYFRGLGLGRVFVSAFLPGGKAIRDHTVSEVLNERYAEQRAAVLDAEADAEEEAAEKESDPNKKQKRKTRAKKSRATAKKLRAGRVKGEILRMFDSPAAATDFASAIRRLDIPPKYHKDAADHIIAENVKKARVERTLAIWWDEISGAAERRAAEAEAKAQRDKMRKSFEGTDPVQFLLQIVKDLDKVESRIELAMKWVHLFDANSHRIIETKLVRFADILMGLAERSREAVGGLKDVTPAQRKMLSHRKG